MTFEQFSDMVDEAFMGNQSLSNRWRYGQSLMNVLWQTYPDKYEDIIGTEYDCFYSNEIVPKTLKKLKEEWE